MPDAHEPNATQHEPNAIQPDTMERHKNVRESDGPPRVDRSVVSVYKLGEEPSDVHHWLSRPPEERVAEVERIRAEYHNWPVDPRGNPTVPRLQRVFRVRER